MDEPPNMGVEAQLAVIRTKLDMLVSLNQTRGEDHETRLRLLEQRAPEFITRKGAIALTVVMCTIATAATNVAAFLLR